MCAPLISVVTIAFNSGDGLRRTMESVIAQTYRPLEYVIVDGGSTDGSYDAVAGMADRARELGIRLVAVSEKDHGIYDAMNKGARMASGLWINYMNAGDRFFSPDAIKDVFAHDIAPDTGMVYGDYIREKSYASLECRGVPPEMAPRQMLSSHQAMFTLTSLLRENPFDTSFRIVADYNFVHSMYMRGVAMRHVPVVVALCEAEEGVSSRQRLRLRKECAIIRNEPVDSLPWRARHYAYAVKLRLTRAVNSLIPSGLLQNIKRANRRRLERRNRKKTNTDR